MDEIFLPLLQKIEQHIDSFLPKEPSDAWGELSFETKCPAEGRDQLIRPTRALVDLGGKRWRPLLSVLCARAASGGDAEELSLALCPLVEAAHTASLIHDDIEDRSPTRRGASAAYVAYGLDTAVNAASWLYFQAATCIKDAPCSDALKLRLYDTYFTEMRRMHLGQAMDIAWHSAGGKVPTEAEYLFMTKCKTGSLAALAAAAGVLCAGADNGLLNRAKAISRDIGAGFQIIDDVINLTAGAAGKRRGDDIVEGKKSLIVIDFIERNKDNPGVTNELFTCFSKATREGVDSDAVQKAIDLLNDSHSLERAASRGMDLIHAGTGAFLDLFGRDNEDAHLIEQLFVSMIPAVLSKQGGKNA